MHQRLGSELMSKLDNSDSNRMNKEECLAVSSMLQEWAVQLRWGQMLLPSTC
jgi:hypothetical protein